MKQEIIEQIKAEEEAYTRMEDKMYERLYKSRERREKELRDEKMVQNIKKVEDDLKEKSQQNKPSIIKKCINMQETKKNESENSPKL